MIKQINECLKKMRKMFPTESVCITLTCWDFSHDNIKETKFSLYRTVNQGSGKTVEFGSIEDLAKCINFICDGENQNEISS